jgi:hypothetical protein
MKQRPICKIDLVSSTDEVVANGSISSSTSTALSGAKKGDVSRSRSERSRGATDALAARRLGDKDGPADLVDLGGDTEDDKLALQHVVGRKAR